MPRRTFIRPVALAFLTLCVLALSPIVVPAPARTAPDDEVAEKDSFLSTLEWRCIGPSRGGRVQSVAGVVGDRTTYYMGATGGGVWKTDNAGATWRNVTDGYVKTGSVGAVAVAPSDSNVVYVGMGEADIRGNFSHGDGVYKSVDAGKTWEHIGLEDTRQIGRIVIHPRDPETVYVAAIGHVFGPNAQRGVFRTSDGGASWEKVLYIDDETGAVDVSLDPHNPRNIFAAFWRVSRTPWSLESGGETSGLYRSMDGGDSWKEVTKGLPKGIKGKIGVTVSRAQRDRVWAIVEAEDGGVFRSDDLGESWQRVNSEAKLRQRAWYYTHIYADSHEPDTVYVLNVRFHKSIDGGRSFSAIRVPHGDNHDLWIDPADNQRMIEGNDGGANVSFDGGQTWSRQDNQPTAQFYHVTTDNQFPYRVYGAQQDNSTASISSQNRLGGRDRFYAVGGGESGYIAVHPDDSNIVYAGSFGGFLTRYDHGTGQTRSIMIWPENPMGWGAGDLVHRFQWTFPIFISRHDHDAVYVAGNRLFRSTDRGQSWEAVSPDLTTDDKTKQGPSGGPITKDNTSVEYYCTIFAAGESPLEKGLMWAGSDDGLVHVTSDGGETWENVTPPGMGDWPMISNLEPSPHDADSVYLAVNRYKMDDFSPYIYKSDDRGKSWSRITKGIDREAFVRVVREDPEHEGLLFAGTETGVWYSANDGKSWERLQLNLPVVPVTDLVVHGDDLVISTQGRSFWILDDITPLRQLTDGVRSSDVHLFTPGVAYRESWAAPRVHFYFKELAEQSDDAKVKLAFVGADGEVVREFTGKTSDGGAKPAEPEPFGFGGGDSGETFPMDAGMNVFEWNMRHAPPATVKGAVLWGPNPRGPRVAPGKYTVRMTVGEKSFEAPLMIQADPRVETTQNEFEDQVEFLLAVSGALDEAHRSINSIRSVRKQINATVDRATKHSKRDSEEIKEAGDAILEELKQIEEELIQTRSKSPQDPLNYPIKINDKLNFLQALAEDDYAPTAQARKVYARLKEQLDAQVKKLEQVMGEGVVEFNELVRKRAVPAVIVPEDEDSPESDRDDVPASRKK